MGKLKWMKNGLGWLPVLMLGAFATVECNPITYRDIAAYPPYLAQKSNWADSVIQTLSPRERIAQLFMVAAYSNKDSVHENELSQLVETEGIGGLIFFQGGPVRQARLTNELQSQAKVPLWIGMDAEWGLAMRLDSTIAYPRQMSLGAIQDSELVYDFGAEMARQLKRLGVHVSFSPVVDINSNPNNPVIGNRSFGESKERVAELGVAYMKGLQDHGVLANAKHFPGHGDTDSDSHHTLPLVRHPYERLDSMELYPFRRLIREGVGSVMVAHLDIPGLDSSASRASTLSPAIVTSLLRDSLNFKGLAFTDALNMKGVSAFFKPGEVDVLALLAGNDVLLFPEDVPKAISSIESAIDSALITQDEIDRRCLRILRAKEWLGLTKKQFIDENGLYESLNSPQALALHKKLIEASTTVVLNKQSILPLGAVQSNRIAVLNIGKDGKAFNSAFANYFDADVMALPASMDFTTSRAQSEQLKDYNLVVINVFATSQRPSKRYGISEQTARLIRELSARQTVITNLFANPYALNYLDGVSGSSALTVAYQDDDVTQETLAEILSGSAFALGKLPVSVGNLFALNQGNPLDQRTRMRHSSPETTGITAQSLAGIDAIANEGILKQAYPGCRVLVAKDGNIIYDKSFGHLTYEEKEPVTRETIYDLASITKIVSSTAAAMRLQDEGKINITWNLCDYLDVCDTSDFYQINLMEMMSHNARLQAWIPFYQNTLERGQLKESIYSTTPKEGYCTQVANGLYICDSYEDSLKQAILQSSLRKEREYKYSDLGYYFLKEIIESQSGAQLEDFVDSVFYAPLGLKTMGYLPMRNHPSEQIAPTEYDLTFRKQLIRGHVHDQGAAMQGGVGGHAGVFSTAEDLAVMMQLFMNGGSYGGVRYLEEETLNFFTACHFCEEDNRRGIGFDKPLRVLNNGPTCNGASANSFGHTGFTGTIAWADPDHGIVYVFLSNRVYPDADNRKLIDLNIRTRIQDVIYKAYGIPDRTLNDASSLSKDK